ncbi:MAG: hypothetical protein IH609_15800 [Dehalococcoidia bacterium]|nr:hypothetical protein [Dehalococcoidia bacterium]
MRSSLLLTAVLASVVMIGCGGDSDGGDGGADRGSSSSRVVNAPPPGQARVTVDNRELTFTEPGAIACKVSDEEFSFSFRIGDNETTIGAGGVYGGGMWSGEIRMTIANPEGERGPLDYVVSLPDIGRSTLAFEGKSMSYSGPWKRQPPNDGSNPPAVDAGAGTVSVTCP